VPLLAAPLTALGAPVLQQLRRRAYTAPGAEQGQQRQHQQQQQQADTSSVAAKLDGLASVLYWLHAQRLMDCHPASWQQHLARHLLPPSSSNGSHSSGGHLLAADMACDWCCGPLSQAAGRDSSKGVWDCPSCRAAQYCSQGCADAARQVHNANCW
jgi:hypothetical protein